MTLLLWFRSVGAKFLHLATYFSKNPKMTLTADYCQVTPGDSFASTQRTYPEMVNAL